MTAYLLERALVGDRFADQVLVRIADGRFVEVTVGGTDPEAETVPGLTVPGLANAHSHAFHRALRGRTQRERGSFWTWREQMYAVAQRLDPDSYHRLALATYREMALAGITSVGEFHYLHHQPDGSPYADPNAMGEALIAAARGAGLRIALLDTCYLSSGFGAPAEGVQTRYDDGSADAWAERAGALATDDDGVVIGAAVHSVRAVPEEALPRVGQWAAERGAPLHVHVSEQVAENRACLEHYGRTPVRLLADAGLVGERTTAVHATHLTDDDIGDLGSARAYACFTPTTERDLGDGIGPGRALAAAGARLTLGSDSHAIIDPMEEMRALELDERLATQQRGHWQATELLTAGTVTGQESLGFEAGALAVGRRADLVVLDPASVRTAGTGRDAETVVFAASAADVRRVMADGDWIAAQDDQDQVAAELDREISALWKEIDG